MVFLVFGLHGSPCTGSNPNCQVTGFPHCNILFYVHSFTSHNHDLHAYGVYMFVYVKIKVKYNMYEPFLVIALQNVFVYPKKHCEICHFNLHSIVLLLLF